MVFKGYYIGYYTGLAPKAYSKATTQAVVLSCGYDLCVGLLSDLYKDLHIKR